MTYSSIGELNVVVDGYKKVQYFSSDDISYIMKYLCTD